MNMTNLLSGTRTLESTTSKYNGKIQVTQDFTWGTRITASGLTQSGGIVTRIWEETLRKVLREKQHAARVLILGLGGGSAAKLVSQYWVGAEITGVDIDKKMVDLGKKYLGLNKIDIDIVIEDAEKFLIRNLKFEKKKYDLILVDLYNGDKFPKKFEEEKFLKLVLKLLSFRGVVVFNRLYGPDKRSDSMRFGRALEKIFKKVDYIFPQANVELICYN